MCFLSLIVLVLRQEAEQRATRVGEDGARLRGLARVAEVGDLSGGHTDAAQLAEQGRDVVVDGAGDLLPGRTELAAPLLDVRASLVGQHARAAVAGLFGADEPFVLELRERRIDRAGARPPHAVRALLDLLHDLVAVARLLGQQEQRSRADVAAPRARPAREPARPTRERTEAAPTAERRAIPAGA